MKRRREKDVSLLNNQFTEVNMFQSTSVGIVVELFRRNVNPVNPFAGRESALHVTISNQGESEIVNAIFEAFCSDNLQLVDSGALFGSQRRHVRLPDLKSTKSIKYKLALRPNPSFVEGSVTFTLRSAQWQADDDNLEFTFKVESQR